MAVSSSALNLAQYAIMSNDPLVAAVTFSLIDAGSILGRDIPFVNKASLVANGVRWEGSLPTVSWASINEEGTTSSGTPTAYQEQAYTLRNYVDVDKLLVMDVNQIVDPRAGQVDAFMRAIAYDFNDKFINNVHPTGEAKAPVGIRGRIDNGTTFGVRSENKINGNAVDMTQAAATAITFGNFVELLDQLLWSVDSPEGNGVTLYMNDTMSRRFSNLSRRLSGQGGFGTATDQLGRDVITYKNAVVRDPGYKADQSTRIITSTETTAGVDGSSTYTSVYAVNYGTDHFFGWQFAPLLARDLGLQDNGVIYRTFIDWAGGLMNASNRSIGRLYGIKLA
jgi:hypothetical protein